MKNKILKIIGIIVILLLILIATFNINRILENKETNEKAESIKDISFEPYSNENNLIVLVTVQDDENGIETIEYVNKDGQQAKINGYKKNKIAIDYEIQNDGEYKFIAYNGKGEKIEKTLVIDSTNKQNDTLGDLIDIQVNPIIDSGRTATTKADITIDYKYGFGQNYYKIGNTTSWNIYNDTFQIDSYSILNSNLQNSDNRTITIYAKKEDTAKNKITITKETTELDLDMPAKPQISSTAGQYAILTSSGVKIPSTTEIQFDNRNDITNYYSLDKGNTWIKYEGQFTADTAIIMYAKSVKNNSGLETISQIAINPTANDALTSKAYDGTTSTTYTIGNNTRLRINVDPSMYGKNIYLTASENAQPGGLACYLDAILSNGSSSRIHTTTGRNPGYTRKSLTIPQNTNYLIFGTNAHPQIHWTIYEVEVN